MGQVPYACRHRSTGRNLVEFRERVTPIEAPAHVPRMPSHTRPHARREPCRARTPMRARDIAHAHAQAVQLRFRVGMVGCVSLLASLASGRWSAPLVTWYGSVVVCW